ncbi:MAG TPA: mycofactocin-coupled SDR family oxidoreductase [Acidimicrobiales bacterium]
MTDRVAGKVALVTGAARGQGRSHAVRLAAEGADIIALDIATPIDVVSYPGATPDDLAETVRQVEAVGRRIMGRPVDVRQRAALAEAVADGIAQFGRLDIVVPNAGICPPGAPFWQISQEEWATVLDINLTGVWNTVSAAVPPMIEMGRGGSVVLTSSSSAIKSPPNLADYSASKHGVIGLMETMAVELGSHYIRVNAICPGSVDTVMIQNDAMYRFVRPELEHPSREDTADVFRSMNPIPEPWVAPLDVSNAVVWLASDEARFVTGVTLPVDLGLVVNWP